jgi:hypothetical protein
MYEHRSRPLLSRRRFIRCLLLHGFAAGAVIVVSLGAGVLGYRFLEGLPWVDALLNVSMILGGMGPVDPLHGTAAKIFASLYALFSGIVFLVTAAILMAPVVHRFLHHHHLDSKGG